jgi:hypothetical protein
MPMEWSVEEILAAKKFAKKRITIDARKPLQLLRRRSLG